jgi:hypothetical protein
MPSKWLTIGLPIFLFVVISLTIVLLLTIKPKKHNKKKYDCDDTGACNPKTNGKYTDSNCGGNCKPPAQVTYDCDDTGACNPKTNGKYTDSNCGGNCKPPAQVTYDCDDTGACKQTTNGKYNVANCTSQCVIPPMPRNNNVIQVAVMDYNQFENNLQNLIPFITKYVPNKILWKTTGPDCATATATMDQHIAAMIQICASYKSQNLPYPNVALFPDLSTTSCFFGTGQDCKDASVLYPVVATYTKQWNDAVKSTPNIPEDVVPYLCNELVVEQESVVNGGSPDAFAACRSTLPSYIALSCMVAFTQLTSGNGELIKNSIIGDNSFRPGFVYLEMYNMYTDKAPYLYDVTPSTNTGVESICIVPANQCDPPLDNSIYGGTNVMTPENAAARIMAIMTSFGKFAGFPETCSAPCSLRNFVFMFSYEEATSGTGPLYLLGNTVNPWTYDLFTRFSNTFVNSVVAALKPVLPSVTNNDVQVGVYNLTNALKQWGV